MPLVTTYMHACDRNLGPPTGIALSWPNAVMYFPFFFFFYIFICCEPIASVTRYHQLNDPASLDLARCCLTTAAEAQRLGLRGARARERDLRGNRTDSRDPRLERSGTNPLRNLSRRVGKRVGEPLKASPSKETKGERARRDERSRVFERLSGAPEPAVGFRHASETVDV